MLHAPAVVLIRGRGSCLLPHTGPTHWLTVGGQVGLDNVSGRGSSHLSVSRCHEYCVYTAFSVSGLSDIQKPQTVFSAIRSASLHNTCHFIWKASLKRILF